MQHGTLPATGKSGGPALGSPQPGPGRPEIRPGILHIAGRTWFVEPVPNVPGVLFTDRRMVAGVAIDPAALVIRVYHRAPLALLHAVAFLRRAGEGVGHG